MKTLCVAQPCPLGKTDEASWVCENVDNWATAVDGMSVYSAYLNTRFFAKPFKALRDEK